jgi:hypothetical protein
VDVTPVRYKRLISYVNHEFYLIWLYKVGEISYLEEKYSFPDTYEWFTKLYSGKKSLNGELCILNLYSL